MKTLITSLVTAIVTALVISGVGLATGKLIYWKKAVPGAASCEGGKGNSYNPNDGVICKGGGYQVLFNLKGSVTLYHGMTPVFHCTRYTPAYDCTDLR